MHDNPPEWKKEGLEAEMNSLLNCYASCWESDMSLLIACFWSEVLKYSGRKNWANIK